MLNHEKYTELIQWHNAIEFFDYNLAIDWAIELIRKGKESENILILSSFSKPVEKDEIKRYISGAIKELNLEEKYGSYSNIANVHFYLEQIIQKIKLRENLSKIKDICLNLDYEYELTTFYLLYHGWLELEEIGQNYYYEGATIENIEEIIIEQANNWIEKYVNSNESIIISKNGRLDEKTKHANTGKINESIWKKIGRMLKIKF